jgi:hypothetical protein
MYEIVWANYSDDAAWDELLEYVEANPDNFAPVAKTEAASLVHSLGPPPTRSAACPADIPRPPGRRASRFWDRFRRAAP